MVLTFPLSASTSSFPPPRPSLPHPHHTLALDANDHSWLLQVAATDSLPGTHSVHSATLDSTNWLPLLLLIVLFPRVYTFGNGSLVEAFAGCVVVGGGGERKMKEIVYDLIAGKG